MFPAGTMTPENFRTWRFKEMLEALPESIRQLASETFQLFLQNPDHPSLRRHTLGDDQRGNHRAGSISISITLRYRAIYVYLPDQNINLWYWIGSHADYDRFTGRR
jgi:hypothetical protein